MTALSAARFALTSLASSNFTTQRSFASHSNRPEGSAIFRDVVLSLTLAPRWRMSQTRSARRLNVAKYSVVRKLGAFH